MRGSLLDTPAMLQAWHGTRCRVLLYAATTAHAGAAGSGVTTSQSAGAAPPLPDMGSRRSCELLAMEALYGSQKTISATYFFAGPLDLVGLRSSLAGLLAAVPLLGGRMRRHPPQQGQAGGCSPLSGWVAEVAAGAGPAATSLVVRRHSGTAADAAAGTDPGDRFASRPSCWAQMGRAWWGAAPPPLNATLTRFDGGGTALGIAISHALCDGDGFHRVVQAWAGGHTTGCWRDAGRLQLSRAGLRTCLMARGAGEPGAGLQLASARGRVLWGALGWLGAAGGGAAASGPRGVAVFTGAELDAMSATDSRTLGRPVSRGTSLAWRLTVAAARLLLQPAARGLPVALIVPTNVRLLTGAERILSSPQYIGNAVYTMRCTDSANPDLLRRFDKLAAERRAQPGEILEQWLAELQELEAGRLPASSSQGGALEFIFNHQAGFRSAEAAVGFGAGLPLRMVPNLESDTFHTVRSLGVGGGVDVYVNMPATTQHLVPGWAALAGADEFHDAVCRGTCC